VASTTTVATTTLRASAWTWLTELRRPAGWPPVPPPTDQGKNTRRMAEGRGSGTSPVVPK
jgi:hypothetical protein